MERLQIPGILGNAEKFDRRLQIQNCSAGRTCTLFLGRQPVNVDPRVTQCLLGSDPGPDQVDPPSRVPTHSGRLALLATRSGVITFEQG